MARINPREGSSSIFFVYDHTVLQREEDDLIDAILFFYPPYESADEQCSVCGQLMGMSEFLLDCISQSGPCMFKLQRGKFAMKRVGNYSFVLQGELEEQDDLLRRHLQSLYETFVLFCGSIDNIRQQFSQNKLGFGAEMSVIWGNLCPSICCTDSHLDRSFMSVPSLELSKVNSDLYLQASNLLQSSQRRPGVMVGAILYKYRVLCSQLCPLLTRKIQAYRPEIPCSKIPVDFSLPSGIKLISVYVTNEEYSQLEPYSNSKSLTQCKHCANSKFRCSHSEVNNGLTNVQNDSSSNMDKNGKPLSSKTEMNGDCLKENRLFVTSRPQRLSDVPILECDEHMNTEDIKTSHSHSVNQNKMTERSKQKSVEKTENEEQGHCLVKVTVTDENETKEKVKVNKSLNIPIDLSHSVKGEDSESDENDLDLSHKVSDIDLDLQHKVSEDNTDPSSLFLSLKLPDKSESVSPSVSMEDDKVSDAVFTRSTEGHKHRRRFMSADMSLFNPLKDKVMYTTDNEDFMSELESALSGDESSSLKGQYEFKGQCESDDAQTEDENIVTKETESISDLDAEDSLDIAKTGHMSNSFTHKNSDISKDSVNSLKVKTTQEGEQFSTIHDSGSSQNTIIHESLSTLKSSTTTTTNTDMLANQGSISSSSSSVWQPAEDNLQEVALYIQKHSDICLVLVMDSEAAPDQAIINAIYKENLTQIAELDYHIKEALHNSSSQGFQDGYRYLKYDSLFETITGNSQQALMGLDEEFHGLAGEIHTSFEDNLEMDDILFRSYSNSCVGHKSFSHETYFSVNPGSGTTNKQDNRDPAYTLEASARHNLSKQHNMSIL